MAASANVYEDYCQAPFRHFTAFYVRPDPRRHNAIFMLLVTDASLPSVEICSDRSAAKIVNPASETL